MMTYTMDIAGLKRDLPLCPVSDDLKGWLGDHQTSEDRL